MAEEKTKKKTMIAAGIIVLLAAIALGVIHFVAKESHIPGKKMQGFSANQDANGDIDVLFNTRSCRNGNFAGVDFTQYKSNDFAKVSAPDSDFTGANISSVNFNISTLTNCDFTNATMANTSFQKANLNSSVMESANMSGVYAPNSSMQSVNFSNATLLNVRFMNAQLQNATFEGATITGASFSAANMCGAKLDGATIDSVSVFKNATYDSSTTFPSGFDPAKRGMIKK